jgi:fucose 4-O-acetylase-like acetyltransferase
MADITFPGALCGEASGKPDSSRPRERMPSLIALTSPQSTELPAPQPVVSRRRRDPWFDNAKMLLVTLVVVGHMWALLPQNPTRGWLYDFLYLWHMPAFVIVTGHLSRSFTWSRDNLVRLVTTVAVPYVVFETAMALFRTRFGGETGRPPLYVEPLWPLWFLAVLFLWRLATPALLSSRASFPLAVVLSLLGGLLEGDVLDVGRALGMLPFFVLGLHARREHLTLLRSAPVRVMGLGVVAAALLAARSLHGRLPSEWFYYRSSYADLDAGFAEGVLIRLALLLLGGVVALSVLAWVPRVRGWFSRLGAASMVVYLFHGFLVRGAMYADTFAWTVAHPRVGLLATTALSVVLALALAAPPVARRLDVLVDPVGALRRARERPWGREEAPGS